MVGGERQPPGGVPRLHARPLEDVAAPGDRHGLTDPRSRALVTGGAGFIGSHLVGRLLADDCDVCVVDDLSTGSASNVPAGARFERADICDVDALREVVAGFKPEVVFHAAAQTDVRRSIREPDFDARVNVLGGLNVLRAAVAVEARRIVYASSAAVYGGDVVEATLRAAAGPSGVAANVGWGREVSDLELFREVAAATGFTNRPTHAADRRGDIARICFDPAMARRTWDWRAAVSLEDGVRRVVESARANPLSRRS